MIRHIPNVLTTLRLLLAAPIYIMVLRESYAVVLWLAVFAGLSDGLDGWLARRFNAQTRYGAVLDPLADKALLTGSYVCLAIVGVIPVWLAVIICGRDMIIVGGATTYRWLYGPYAMAPSLWGKLSTLAQIAYIVAVIAQQVWPVFPDLLLNVGLGTVVVLAAISLAYYVLVWSRKALVEKRDRQS